MFPSHRHTPLPDPQRKRCPVCLHSVYSLAGIHPQCAERLADPPKAKNKARGDSQADERAEGGAGEGCCYAYQAPLVEQTDEK